MECVSPILPAPLFALPGAQAALNGPSRGLHANLKDRPGNLFFPPFAMAENSTRAVLFPPGGA